ncbi:MAG: 50S ribosomal protein L18 [Candidatus Omnitrophota bacterium]|jgi:large subunit ribosomal protein L18|nr:MAG: 50S ribosomal protein L18 [Candidatus Omnitrophota bacterium]
MKKRKGLKRQYRHVRIRTRLSGDNEKPRLVVRRSLKNFSAQLVDDIKHRTIFSLSTLDKEIKHRFPYAGNVKAAAFFGEVFAQKAKEKGVSRVVFDRAGYAYHGRVKVFAESLRKGGLEF